MVQILSETKIDIDRVRLNRQILQSIESAILKHEYSCDQKLEKHEAGKITKAALDKHVSQMNARTLKTIVQAVLLRY